MRAARLDYRWHLRKVMASRDMFATTDLPARWLSGASGCLPARSTGW